MRVLVVDDETIVRQFICLILRRHGHETVEAEGAAEALRIAGQQECQLVITDCMMPGISGPELIAQLKYEGYPARYLLISAYEAEHGNAGIPFLAKPFTPAQLLAAIEKLQAKAAPLPDLQRDLQEAKSAWLAAIKEQDEVLLEVPSQIPGTDGSLRIEKAGSKRKAAYHEYIELLRKYHDSVKKTGAPSDPALERHAPKS